jgi:hypothetical protein
MELFGERDDVRIAGVPSGQLTMEPEEPITDYGRGHRCGQLQRRLRDGDSLDEVLLGQPDIGEPNIIKNATAIEAGWPALTNAQGVPFGPLRVSKGMPIVFGTEGQLFLRLPDCPAALS